MKYIIILLMTLVPVFSFAGNQGGFKSMAYNALSYEGEDPFTSEPVMIRTLELDSYDNLKFRVNGEEAVYSAPVYEVEKYYGIAVGI